MDRLWAGWRMPYLKGAGEASRGEECVMCVIAQAQDLDSELYVIARGRLNFVVMNIFPYASGHLMVVPYEHIGELADMSEEARLEVFSFLEKSVEVLKLQYSPHGFNLGANLGRSAGAGIADHIHFHVVPRWDGDANFMTTTAEARVLPESLDVTRDRIRQGWGTN